MGAIFRDNGFPKRLIVSFDALHAYNHRRLKVSGDRVVLACEADHLNIGCNDTGWYQSPEVHDLLETVAPICRRYDEVVLYGHSMGGYGALIMSKALGATNVVAFVPQFSIDPRVAPYDDRFAGYAKDIEFVFDDMLNTASETAPKHIVFDPFFDVDREHYNRISLLPNVKPVGIWFSGHYPGQYLLEAGILKSTVVDLLLNKPNDRERRRRVREGRRSSHRFFVEMASHEARRGRIRRALELVNAAYVLQPDNISVIETFSAILLGDPVFFGLSHAMVRLVQKEHPDWTHYDGTRENAWHELEKKMASVVRKREPDVN